MATRALSETQLSILRSLKDHKTWKRDCGWVWRSPSDTERSMQALEKRGLADYDAVKKQWSINAAGLLVLGEAKTIAQADKQVAKDEAKGISRLGPLSDAIRDAADRRSPGQKKHGTADGLAPGAKRLYADEPVSEQLTTPAEAMRLAGESMKRVGRAVGSTADFFKKKEDRPEPEPETTTLSAEAKAVLAFQRLKTERGWSAEWQLTLFHEFVQGKGLYGELVAFSKRRK